MNMKPNLTACLALFLTATMLGSPVLARGRRKWRLAEVVGASEAGMVAIGIMMAVGMEAGVMAVTIAAVGGGAITVGWSVGIYGLGFWPGYYGGYYPYYGSYGYPATVITPPPTVYIQQSPPVTQNLQQGYWSYCDNPKGYYPPMSKNAWNVGSKLNLGQQHLHKIKEEQSYRNRLWHG